MNLNLIKLNEISRVIKKRKKKEKKTTDVTDNVVVFLIKYKDKTLKIVIITHYNEFSFRSLSVTNTFRHNYNDTIKEFYINISKKKL